MEYFSIGRHFPLTYSFMKRAINKAFVMTFTQYFTCTTPVTAVSLRFIVQKVCRACSRTSYRIVPLNNLKNYLYNEKSEIKVDINNSSEKF